MNLNKTIINKGKVKKDITIDELVLQNFCYRDYYYNSFRDIRRGETGSVAVWQFNVHNTVYRCLAFTCSTMDNFYFCAVMVCKTAASW